MSAGTRLADRYELEELAGQGAAGSVYRARDLVTKQRVAVKVVTSRGGAARFAREASILSELEHPHIVRYVDSGRANGQPFLVMEWLEGEDLETRLARGTLSVEQTLELADRTASALAKAHARGVVHRDLKPGNLFLVDGHAERPKVLDFGVAFQGHTTNRDTAKGRALGTPTYMAPEQAQGSKIDARADVFALGCVLFECLAGRPAFQATSLLALMTKVLLEDPPPLRELEPGCPAALEDLLRRMMNKRPSHRPANGREVAEAIEQIRLDDYTIATSPRALTASERTLVSVLVVGARSEREGAKLTMADVPFGYFDDDAPDDLTEHIDDAHADPVAPIAARYGGRREFLRDGTAVVLLSTTGSATEQAMRAARCGLELHELAVGAPVGLATGMAQVGARAPVGDVIDRVVGLLDDHADARVHVDDVTARLLPPRFVVEGSHLLTETQIEFAGPAHGELVGRQDELAALEARLSTEAASAVVVLGEPGIGKSRLRRAFLERVTDRAVGFGWGDPMRSEAPFAVLALALRDLLGLAAGGELGERRAALRGCVRALFDRAEADRVAAFVGEVVGVPFDDSLHPALGAARRDARTMRVETERALWDLLGACCAREPVLLVLEDLQWCDVPTVELLESALLFLSNQPFAVLALARPSLEERLPGLWRERGRTDLALGPLSAEQSRALAAEMLGQASDDATAAAIAERSAGNPFYLEEMARAVRADAPLDHLPPTIAALLRQRLVRMPDDARRVLRAASILGERFDARSLDVLLGEDAAALGWLAPLVEREILFEREDGRYGFRHVLLRDAVYESLTEADRRLGHRLAAEHLSKTGGADALALARHFERAGEPAEAAPQWLEAARSDLAANAYETAIEHARRGLGAKPPEPLQVQLHLTIALASRPNSRWEQIADAAEAVLALVEPMVEGWWAGMHWAVLAYRVLGQPDEARSLVQTTRECAAASVLGHDPLRYVLRVAQSALLLGDRESTDALVGIVDAHLPGQAIDDPSLRAEREEVRSQRALYDGDLGGYLAGQQRRLEVCDEAGLTYTAVTSGNNLGFALTLVGRYEDAEAVLRRSQERARSIRATALEIGAEHNLGMCLMHLGRLDEAVALERHAVERYVEFGDERMVAGSLAYLASIHLARGELDEADEALTRAHALAAPLAPGMLPYVIANQGRVLLRRGNKEAAAALLEPLVEGLDRGEPVEGGEMLARVTLAEALDACGRRDEARRAVSRARERLDAYAAKIVDEEARRSFLERVTENAQVGALDHAWSD